MHNSFKSTLHVCIFSPFTCFIKIAIVVDLPLPLPFSFFCPIYILAFLFYSTFLFFSTLPIFARSWKIMEAFIATVDPSQGSLPNFRLLSYYFVTLLLIYLFWNILHLIRCLFFSIVPDKFQIFQKVLRISLSHRSLSFLLFSHEGTRLKKYI